MKVNAPFSNKVYSNFDYIFWSFFSPKNKCMYQRILLGPRSTTIKSKRPASLRPKKYPARKMGPINLRIFR